MRWRTRRPPSCHQPCVSPVSSRSLAGSVKKIWPATANTSASLKPSSRGARKSGATRMSLFSSTTISFLGAANAGFAAPAKPRVLRQGENRDVGELLPQEIRAAVARAVVHHQDLVGRIPSQRHADAGKVLGQQVFS